MLRVLKFLIGVTMAQLLACALYNVGGVPGGWARVENHWLGVVELVITNLPGGNQYLCTHQRCSRDCIRLLSRRFSFSGRRTIASSRSSASSAPWAWAPQSSAR